MSRERTRERLYGEEETSEILRRAAQLDAKKQLERPALSLGEIEEIARDSGIDPSLVHQAARDVENQHSAQASTRWLGAPARLTIERVVDGEIGTEHHEALAAELRQAAASAVLGQLSVVGRSLSWSGSSRRGAITVDIAPRDGKTWIRIEVNASQLAGGLFGGIMGGVGGGVGFNVAWILPAALHLPPEAGVGGLLGVVGLSYFLARSLFGWRVRAAQRQAEALADRLQQHVLAALEP